MHNKIFEIVETNEVQFIVVIFSLIFSTFSQIMDWETSLLCLGLVVGSAFLLFIISTLGTRGQSYEEVVAANRRLVAQRGLLDDPVKQKKLQQQQSKKNKKAGKKVRHNLCTVSTEFPLQRHIQVIRDKQCKFAYVNSAYVSLINAIMKISRRLLSRIFEIVLIRFRFSG